MRLEIKEVRSCRQGAYGYFKILGSRRARIAISIEKNRTLNQYAETLLHELLHFYTAILKAEGFHVGPRKEHKWIESCELTIIHQMQRYLKRRN